MNPSRILFCLLASVLALPTMGATYHSIKRSTQKHRSIYATPRPSKPLPSPVSAPQAPKATTPPEDSTDYNPGAEKPGAKSSSPWLLKKRFQAKSDDVIVSSRIQYSFIPGKPETIQSLCVRIAEKDLFDSLVDDDSKVLYYSGYQNIQKLGIGLAQLKSKMAEWTAVAISNDVANLDKDMHLANFPERMQVGPLAYKLSLHFIVKRDFVGSSMERTHYYVEFRKVECDWRNDPKPGKKPEPCLRLDAKGLDSMIELLNPNVAFKELQALKEEKKKADAQESLFK